jgi:hypothetical protein
VSLVFACRVMRSPVVPASAKQQLSRAVQDLLQQLFTAVTQDRCTQAPGWDRCGCYLLLRALTRSQQFLLDPGLPVLPEAAVSTLKWVKQCLLGPSSTRQESMQQAAHLSAQDDKPFLLLTRLVLTATGAPAAVAAAAAESDGAGYYAAIASAVSAGAIKGAAAPGSGVRWSDTGPGDAAAAAAAAGGANGSRHRGGDVADAAAAAAAGSACVRDPELLCELLDWSGTKVKLALQRLLEPTGGSPLQPRTPSVNRFRWLLPHRAVTCCSHHALLAELGCLLTEVCCAVLRCACCRHQCC